MCRQVMCNRCKKITWSGCGQHVNQVMAGVPKESRCTCANDAPAAKQSGGGLLGKLFGR